MLYFLLYPLLWLLAQGYGAGVRLRHLFYDTGVFRSKKYSIPVICIGNLSVGGTGKTPLLAYCARILIPQLARDTVWLLSRGYRRSTRGTQVLSSTHRATEIGDEPYLLAQKCKNLRVTVDGDRVRGMECILKQLPQPRLVLMDDGAQHRAVEPSSILLLTPYYRPFFRDHLLPLGRLREHRSNASRARAVVLTKCPPDLPEAEKNELRHQIQHYSKPEIPIFFSSLRYEKVVSFGNWEAPRREILVLTGIADPSPLIAYLAKKYSIIQHLCLPDHYAYPLQKIRNVLKIAKRGKLSIFTTEKDYVKIAAQLSLAPDLSAWGWFYVPMDMDFGEDTENFENFLLQELSIYSF